MSEKKSILARLDEEEPSEVIDDAMAEITKLKSQLDEARARIEELEDAPKGLDTGEWASRIENYFILASCGRRDGKSPFELVDADVGLIGMQARRKAIEECAAIAEQDRDFCDYDTASEIAKSIRALLSESKE